ncbi:hypothetical protein SDC9_137524 [bioreactor metagenome]|uniref:Uncharacterized protein n=1 Tax=bioreactor metagenome TaxID=1076179 RepID=A0A645DNP2_9ZZZZ
MAATAQFCNPFHDEPVGAYPFDFCPHPYQHLAQLLHVRLAGGVVDNGFSFCKHGSHQQVSGSGNRCFFQQDILPAEVVGGEGEKLFFLVENQFGAQFHNSVEVRV